MAKKKGMKRRDFLKGAAATCALGSVGALPIIRPPRAYAASPNGVNLLVVYLKGAADIGFHLVQPDPNNFQIGSPLGSRRPNIINTDVAGQELAGTPYVHANDFPVLQTIHDNGNLAIIPRVGLDGLVPSHSHAELAVAYGNLSATSGNASGWLQRFASAHFNVASDLVDLSGGHPTTSAGGGFIPLTSYRMRQMANLNTSGPDFLLGREASFPSGLTTSWRRDAYFLSNQENPVNANAKLDEAQRRIGAYGANSFGIAEADNSIPGGYEIFNDAGREQAGLLFRDAEMIFRYSDSEDSMFNTKVVFGELEYSGWDSHIRQNSLLNGNNDPIDQLNDAIANFRNNTMDASNIWDNTAILIYTEMGRATSENGQEGTDHGDAGAVLAMGGRVNGGVRGALPTSSQILSKTNVIPRDFSFPDVFADVVAGMGYDPGPVFPGFSRRPIGLIS